MKKKAAQIGPKALVLLLWVGLAGTSWSAELDRRAIGQLIGDTHGEVDVDHVLDPIAPDLYPVIGKWERERSAESIEAERESWDGWSGNYAEEVVSPFLALIRATERGEEVALELVAILPMPTEETPHADFGWGIARVHDYDGDGLPEVVVVKAYTSYQPGSTFGEVWNREMTWFSFPDLGGIEVQHQMLLSEHLGGRNDVVQFTREVDYEPWEQGPYRNLVITEVRENRGVESETVTTWFYHPDDDRWTEAPLSPAELAAASAPQEADAPPLTTRPPWLADVWYYLQDVETGEFQDQRIDMFPEDPIDNLVFQADDRGLEYWAMVQVAVRLSRDSEIHRANVRISAYQGGELRAQETFPLVSYSLYSRDHLSVFFRHAPCGPDVEIEVELVETGERVRVPVTYTCGE
jgi:hypothetical protein